MPKKIFFYIHSLHRGAGAENIMFQLTSLLIANGYAVVVCGMVDEYPSFEDELQQKGAVVYRLEMQKTGFVGKIQKLFQLYRILCSEKPDVFMAWLRPAILTGAFVSKLARIKVRVANLRGPALNKSRIKIILDRLFSKYDRYIAVTESTKQIFSQREKFPADKITVINNGIEQVNVTEQRLAQKTLILGTVGRLYAEKNQTLLLKIAEILKQKGIDFKLYLVGDGPAEAMLKEQVNRLNLAKEVIFTGWQKDVYKYLAQFDIFVLPSKYEGHSSAILQAWQAGVPVVASNVIGIKDVIINGYNGLLFDINKPAEAVNIVLNLKNNPEYRNKISANAKRTIEEKYTQEIFNQKYLSFFAEVTQKSN